MTDPSPIIKRLDAVRGLLAEIANLCDEVAYFLSEEQRSQAERSSPKQHPEGAPNEHSVKS
jgi:hypothetical protein